MAGANLLEKLEADAKRKANLVNADTEADRQDKNVNADVEVKRQKPAIQNKPDMD